MNRGLLITLALVAGLSVYLMSSGGDDELLAPDKQGGAAAAKTPARAKAGGRDEDGRSSGQGQGQGQGRRGAAATPGSAPIEPWVASALTDGVTQWRARLQPPIGTDQGMDAKGRFAWASMQAPPPPPVRAAAPAQDLEPPPPMAPRFPHAWVGRFDDEDAQRAVLAGPQSTWVVRVGDVIEGQWRIDRIQDRSMSLTYLPLQQQQTLAMR